MKALTVQEVINSLMDVEDKSIHCEMCPSPSSDRYLLHDVDIIYDGEPEHERNVDLNCFTDDSNELTFKRMGYLAKSNDGNLYQFTFTKDNKFIVNGVEDDPKHYEIFEIFHSESKISPLINKL